MSTIRSGNLYITSQLGRWLKWMSEMENASDPESQKTTPDILAERILREHIIKLYPAIADIEGAYWKARSELDEKAVDELRKQKVSS